MQTHAICDEKNFPIHRQEAINSFKSGVDFYQKKEWVLARNDLAIAMLLDKNGDAFTKAEQQDIIAKVFVCEKYLNQVITLLPTPSNQSKSAQFLGYLNKAMTYLIEHKNYKHALFYFTKCIHHPEGIRSSQVYFGRGSAHFDLSGQEKDYADALGDFTHAIWLVKTKLDEAAVAELPYYYLRRGILQAVLGRMNSAEEDYYLGLLEVASEKRGEFCESFINELLARADKKVILSDRFAYYELAVRIDPKQEYLLKKLAHENKPASAEVEEECLDREKFIESYSQQLQHLNQELKEPPEFFAPIGGEIYDALYLDLLPSESIEKLKTINKRCPHLGGFAMGEMGKLYMLKRDYKNAIKAFDQALVGERQGKIITSLHYFKGSAYTKLQDWQPARKELIEAMYYDKEAAYLEKEHQNILYFNFFHGERALLGYIADKAWQAKENFQHYFDLAIKFLQRGKYDNAVALFNSCGYIAPNFSLTFNERAKAHLGLQNYAKAFEDATIAIWLMVTGLDSSPALGDKSKLAMYYQDRARILKKLGRQSEAEEDYQKEIALSATLKSPSGKMFNFFQSTTLPLEAASKKKKKKKKNKSGMIFSANKSVTISEMEKQAKKIRYQEELERKKNENEKAQQLKEQQEQQRKQKEQEAAVDALEKQQEKDISEQEKRRKKREKEKQRKGMLRKNRKSISILTEEKPDDKLILLPDPSSFVLPAMEEKNEIKLISIEKIELPHEAIECLKKLKLHNPASLNFVVGGLVRDSLLKKHYKETEQKIAAQEQDIDMVTSLLPEEISKIFEVKPNEHEPKLFKINNVEIYCSEYLEKDTTLFADASKRDFTVNTFYADEQGNVFDPTGRGWNHLINKLFVSVHCTKESFAIDPIRMLRLVYFKSKLKFTIQQEEVIKNSIRVNLPLLLTKTPLSKVNAWMAKLFCKGKAVENFDCLFKFDMLHKLLAPNHSTPLEVEEFKKTVQLQETRLKKALAKVDEQYQGWLEWKDHPEKSSRKHYKPNLNLIYAYFIKCLNLSSGNNILIEKNFGTYPGDYNNLMRVADNLLNEVTTGVQHEIQSAANNPSGFYKAAANSASVSQPTDPYPIYPAPRVSESF